MQFTDPKNDVAFRKIFGNDNKKEILISFLNAVLKLDGDKLITWIEILNPYQMPRIVVEKASILDVKARDKAGNTYIVEMQIADKRGLDKRIVYYAAKGFVSQLDVGEDYYKLKPVIFIGILNFDYLEGTKYLSRHLILDAESKEHKLKDLDFNFIELTKFHKTESELDNLIDKWIFFIKHAKELSVIPSNVQDKGLQEAYNEANKHNWSKQELEDYEYASMRETDEKATRMLAEERAEARGKIEKSVEIAKELKKNNVGMDIISKATGLTVEEIEKL
jgi:predicted transposase/invertase (TIGR01784 family)